jgi:hypothetical protein
MKATNKSLTLQTAPQTKHAKYSPSTLKAREICPAFLPSEKESASSIEGSMLHAYLEKPSRKVFQGLAPEQQELIKKIENYIDPYVRNAEKDFREIRLDLRPIGATGCDFGTVDRLLIMGAEAHLIDYKFGEHEVDDPESNIQMWAYVLGVFANFNEVEITHVHVLQPKRDEVGTATFRRSDIPRMSLRVKAIVTRCAQPNPEEVPTTTWCHLCARAATCKSLKQFALAIPDDTVVPVTSDDVTRALVDPVAAGRVYDFARVIETWAKSVRREICDAMRNGTLDVPDTHTLVCVEGRTEIVDVLGVQAFMAEEYGVTPDEFLMACELSVTKLENLVSSKTEKGEKHREISHFREKLCQHGFVYHGAPSAYLKRRGGRKKKEEDSFPSSSV